MTFDMSNATALDIAAKAKDLHFEIMDFFDEEDLLLALSCVMAAGVLLVMHKEEHPQFDLLKTLTNYVEILTEPSTRYFEKQNGSENETYTH